MNHLCHGKITDDQFLEHMIPHHQMAIDMAQQVSRYSNNPAILSLARDIIWSQQNEIWVMKALLRSPTFSSPLAKSHPRKCTQIEPILGCYYPYDSEDYSTKATCDMKFMMPCKKEKIVNNYHKKRSYVPFWRGLSR